MQFGFFFVLFPLIMLYVMSVLLDETQFSVLDVVIEVADQRQACFSPY